MGHFPLGHFARTLTPLLKTVDRVQRLVVECYGGNRSLAARAIGVPRRSLNRVCTKPGVKPRKEMLARLAAHFRGTERWFLTGEGEDPLGPEPSGGQLTPVLTAPLLPELAIKRWNGLLASLDLTPHVEHAWRQLPTAVGLASKHFGVNYRRRPKLMRKMVGAMGREVEGWTLFVAAWIGIDGRDEVRRVMSRPAHVNAARVGFNWYSIMLLNERKPMARMVEALADAHGASESKSGALHFAQNRSRRSGR